LIFLGTPVRHSEGGASQYITILQRSLSLFKGNIPLLQALSADSSFLNLQSTQFSTISKDIPIPYDYIGMIKFPSNQDVGYIKIVEIIQKFVKQATKATSPGNIQKKAGQIRGPPKKVLSKSQAQ
jgi:hypothetical protein